MKLDLPLGLGEERMLLRPGAITYRKKKKENESLSQAPRVSGEKNASETQEAGEKQSKKGYYLQSSTHMRTRRLFEAPVPLLMELRLLMCVEFLLRRLDKDS